MTIQRRHVDISGSGVYSKEWEDAMNSADKECIDAVTTLLRRGWDVRLGSWQYRLKPVSEFQKRTWNTEWQDLGEGIALSDALAELCRDRYPNAIMMVPEGARYDHCTMYRRNPNYND